MEVLPGVQEKISEFGYDLVLSSISMISVTISSG
jgi:hypothetical protein